MEFGCYGRLESVVPPITVPAWMCMATSKDPGALGVYGFRNRLDHSYDKLGIVDSRSIDAVAIWDLIGREGKRSIIIGVPPGYPPRKVNGISVGCFLTPDTTKAIYTHPPEVGREIARLVGEYPVDAHEFRTEDKARLRDEILAMSRKHFEVVRHFLKTQEWDYFQFVEIGLDRMHHGFWSFHDPEHFRYEPGNPFEHAITDYYRYLDDEIGSILELLTDDTVVLVVSDHGARRLDGGFCVNEWLIDEKLLALRQYPESVKPFQKLDVEWRATRAWSEGGYYARVFMNVKGREPLGVIDRADYETVRDDIKARLEATTGPDGKPLGTLVFKPEEVYREVRRIAPDLIVHFGGLAWRSIGGVGYRTHHVRENDTGPDDCNHAQHGAFILAASNSPLQGPVEGAHLLDIAPTLLDLGGYEIPPAMQGKSLVAGRSREESHADDPEDREMVVRDRLSGLGYIS
jgi:predicted AlkP superfamily phosphohydrolase/phosphomutase